MTAPLTVIVGTTIDAADFLNDNGAVATAFPDATNGYYNLYLNGVLQEGGSYTVTSESLTFNVSGSISAGTPLVLEVVELVTVI